MPPSLSQNQNRGRCQNCISCSVGATMDAERVAAVEQQIRVARAHCEKRPDSTHNHNVQNATTLIGGAVQFGVSWIVVYA
jgi:hypothetical protein